ncbi:hypothetical protein [Saccharothrix deserti]|uniref:hypothetical protein n=1 Tax=Saccharothrix deserti TaxID=2593674 RepID=UPI00131C5ABF|nr:hypothetical protein [Saccharothrix deserti]
MTSDLITTYPLPFVLLGTMAALLAVLLWRLVLSAALVAGALWAVAASGGNDAVAVLALAAVVSAAFVLLQPGQTSRRPVRLRVEEVAR